MAPNKKTTRAGSASKTSAAVAISTTTTTTTKVVKKAPRARTPRAPSTAPTRRSTRIRGGSAALSISPPPSESVVETSVHGSEVSRSIPEEQEEEEQDPKDRK